MSLPATRKEAIQTGALRFLTGKPCHNGHIAERMALNGRCIECRPPSAAKWREYAATYRAKNPGSVRASKYRAHYGVELDDLPPKPTACSVCLKAHRKIVLDHSHSTGRVRGWICDDCNIAIGRAGDSPSLLRKLARYVEEGGLDWDRVVIATRDGHGRPAGVRLLTDDELEGLGTRGG